MGFEPIKAKLPRPKIPRLPDPPKKQPGGPFDPDKAETSLLPGGKAVLGGPIVLAAVVVAASVAAFVDAAKAAVSFLTEGFKFVETFEAFQGLSGGAERAEKNLAALSKGASGLVSESELMALATRGIQTGVAKTDKELRNLTRAGHLLGRAVGVGIVEASGRIIDSLSRGSARQLTQLGVSEGAVIERMEELAEASGQAVENIRGGQRTRLFAQAALELAAERAETFDTTMVDFSDVVAQAAAAFKDVRDRFSVFLARSPELIAVGRVMVLLLRELADEADQVPFGQVTETVRKDVLKPFGAFLGVVNPSFLGIRTIVEIGPEKLLDEVDKFLAKNVDATVGRIADAEEAFDVAIEFWSDVLAFFYLGLTGNRGSMDAHQRAIRLGQYRPAPATVGPMVRAAILALRNQIRTLQWIITGRDEFRPPDIPPDTTAPVPAALGAAAARTKDIDIRWRFQSLSQKLFSDLADVESSFISMANASQALADNLAAAVGTETRLGRFLRLIRLTITASISFVQAIIQLALGIVKLLSFQYSGAVAHFISSAAYFLAGATAVALGGRDGGGRSAFQQRRQEVDERLRQGENVRVVRLDVRVQGPWHRENDTLEREVLRRIGAATVG